MKVSNFIPMLSKVHIVHNGNKTLFSAEQGVNEAFRVLSFFEAHIENWTKAWEWLLKMKNIFITIIFIIITLIIIVSKSDWCHHVDKLRAKSTKPVESFKRGFVEETFIIILPHHWIIISSDRHIVNSPCRYFLFTNMFLWIFQKARQSKWQGHSKYENKCHLLWQSLFKSYFQLQQNDQWMAHFK